MRLSSLSLFLVCILTPCFTSTAQDAIDLLKSEEQSQPKPAETEEGATEKTETPEQEKVDPLTGPKEVTAPKDTTKKPSRTVSVYVVPVKDAISKPNEFILRRSIKQAIENEIDVVLLDMNTPGGRLDVTLEMMEMLDRFPGETITFVNPDAISAGAYISMATKQIWFSPEGVMGAAAVVSGGGQEIDESMKAKINSYLLARMRSYTEEYPYRAEVIRAMADLDYELEIDGEVLKKEGELLSVTASEATKMYGSPAKPLLAEGIGDSYEDVLAQIYGKDQFTVEAFEITWSEELAKYLSSIAPILMGLGMLALFIEFKTPGFGVFGISGITMIAIVFASNYVAGLAGMEAFLFFFLGLVLIAVEIFLLPGTVFFMVGGLLLLVGSLIWSLSDIWPRLTEEGGDGLGFTVEAESFWSAMYQTFGALAITMVGLVLVWRFLPKTPLFSKIVHQSVGGMPDKVTVGGGSAIAGQKYLPDLGSIGVVTRPLHPLGVVEIDGQRFEASSSVGSIDKGEPIQVIGYRSFNLLVDRKESE